MTLNIATFVSPKRYMPCPACGQGEHTVSHLAHDTSFGPWFCYKCGTGWIGRIVDDRNIIVDIVDERLVNTQVTLQLVASDSFPVTVVLDSIAILRAGETLEQHIENEPFFYEERECPTNFLPKIHTVIDAKGEEDPHGLFKWIKTELDNG